MGSPIAALENVQRILHGNEVISLTVNHNHDWMPLLHHLFTSPMPYLERLHMYLRGAQGQEGANLHLPPFSYHGPVRYLESRTLCSRKHVGRQGIATGRFWVEVPSP